MTPGDHREFGEVPLDMKVSDGWFVRIAGGLLMTVAEC
jgi:hypothetical protein